MENIPCDTCISLAICKNRRLEENLNCSIIVEHIYGNYPMSSLTKDAILDKYFETRNALARLSNVFTL